MNFNTMEMPIQLVRSHTHHWAFPSNPKHRAVVPTPKVRGVDLWHIISYRPRDRKRPSMKPPVNTPESISRSESRSDIISRKSSRNSRNSGKSSAGQRIPVLGPTRQQTEIYFKNVKRRARKHSSARGMNGPFPSAPTTFRKSPSEVSAKSSDLSSEHSSSIDSPTKLKDTLTKLSSTSFSSSFSSIPRRNGLNSTDPDHHGYNDIRFLAELVKPLQYRLRASNKERKEKVIIPSKHGYHPRSQSPTFKRLLEATEKLHVLCENDSLDGSIRRDYSVTNSDTDNEVNPVRSNDLLSSVSNPFSRNNKTTQIFKTEVPPSKSIPKPSTVPFKEKLEIPRQFPRIDDAISEDETDEGSSTKSDEVYFKVDFKEEESHAELHLFLPHITEPASGQNNSLDNKNGLTNGKEGNNDRVTLPHIPRQSNVTTQRPFLSKRVAKNNGKKKKKKVDNRCPSAKDNDRKVNDHLNDVPTLISMNYENGHQERRHPHGDDTVCDVANCPFHKLMAVARAETYV